MYFQIFTQPIFIGASLTFVSIIFFSYIFPLIFKWFLGKLVKAFIKFDLSIDKIGILWASNVKLSLWRNNTLLLSIICSRIFVKFNFFDRKAKTFFTFHLGKMSIDTNINNLQDVKKVFKKKSKLSTDSHLSKQSPKRFNWVIKALKLYSVEISDLVFRIKLSSAERSPIICLCGNNVNLLVNSETNRLNCQLSVDVASGKIICPSLYTDNWNLLANLRSKIDFDIIFIKKQNFLMHKFLVNIGITKLHVLEEIFHELAQVTKFLNIEDPRVVSNVKKPNNQNILSSYLSLFPKECGLDFEKFEVSLIRVDVNRNLNLLWNKCYASVLQPSDVIGDLRFSESRDKLALSDSELDFIEPRPDNDVPVEEVLKFKTGCYGLRISSCVSTATSWRRLELSGQVDVGSVHVKCRVDNPCLIVNVDELAFWHELITDAQSLFRQLKRRSRHESLISQETEAPNRDSLHYALKLEVNCSHRGQAINLDSLAVIQIINNSHEPGLEFGLKSLVASYEADTPNDDVDKLIQSIDLYSDINTAYCKLINYPSNERFEYIDYFHRWDTSLFMGNVFIWIHKNRAGCLMNQVQFEWSNSLSKATAKIFDTIHTVRNSQSNEPPVMSRSNKSSRSLASAFAKMNLEMKLEHVDIFAVSSRGAFLRQKINIIQVTKSNEDSIEMNFKFCRMVYDMIEPNQEIYPTTTDLSDGNDFSKYFKLICDVGEFTIEYFWNKKAMSINCLDTVNGFWDTAIHLCTQESILNLRTIINSVALIQKPSSLLSNEPRMKFIVHVELKSGMNVKFILSAEHHTILSSDKINFVFGKQRSKMVSNVMKIYCDDQEIFKIQNFSWKEVVPTNKYRQDKEKLKLTDDANRAWEIQADQILISFPYDYNFREWYHDVISIKKFVKNVGSSTKKKEDSSQTIPPDYILLFKKLQIEVKDDPFECQLLDNHLVLRDENEEHEKRVLRMKSQLKKLVKNGGNYTEADYQRCLSQLDQQKQTQYISRILSLRSSVDSQPQNNLLRWTLHNLQLMSLSDSDFYGVDNAIRHIQSIDIDSPYPAGGVTFSTLWCRMISLNVDSWCLQMREYLKPIWEMKDLYVWGRLVVAEQSANEKSKRKVCINIADPWPDVIIERSMPTIKFFHDFSADIKEHLICYGPNWEPCLQWINISMERINRPSRDPSPPLPWWDKNRFRFHGRLWFVADVMDWYYPVSLDPYNNTEFFHWQWTSARVNWENMKWLIDGNLNIFCRSASKYDGDCQLLSWPNLQFKIDIEWICLGNPNDHYSITPMAPEFVTSSDHDTYHYFRSRNVNLSFDFKSDPSEMDIFPRIVFYTNIIKFFEKFKMCTGRVARPIRRGPYFKYFRRRKAVLGRHYKFINVKFNLPQLDIVYWVSLARKSGVHLTTGPISLSAQFQLHIKKVESRLHQRPQSNWSVVQMKSQIRKGRVWLIQTADEVSDDRSSRNDHLSSDYDMKNIFHEKNRYEFIILSHMKYERMSTENNLENTTSSTMMDQMNDFDSEYDLTPKHNLRLVELKVRWTEINRNLVYSMIDIYRHKTLLRKNLSAQALKSIQLQVSESKRNQLSPGNGKDDDSGIYEKHSTRVGDERCNSETNINKGFSDTRKRTNSDNFTQVSEANARSSQPKEHDNVMLRQLLQEVDTAKLYAYCEEESKVVNVVDKLTGLQLSNSTPKVSRNWHLELINSQVMLKTNQLSGYVIVSAARTILDSYEHMPLWKDSQLLTKSSIAGKIECMQYYATVGKVSPLEGQHWLNMCDVEDLENNEDILSGTPEVVGCGKAVGGVVSSCVGHMDPMVSIKSTGSNHADNSAKHGSQSDNTGRIQLQRMISKCSCMVYYISYDRADPNTLPQHLIPPLPLEEDEVTHSSEGATTLTILHSNLSVVTNSFQYHMIVDIINDLILYVEPQRKARDERNKVEFSLLNEEQLKMTILRSQEALRNIVHYLIRLERELRRAVIDEQVTRIRPLESSIKQVKSEIENKNSALSQCIVIYQQMRIQSQRRDLHMRSSFNRLSSGANHQGEGFSNISNAMKLAGQDNGKKSLTQSTPSESMIRSSAEVIRRNEVCFEHATWGMTENDGQIGHCDVGLRGFIYSKITRGDDSGAHNFELNTVKVESLIKNSFFKEVLMMDASSEMNIGGPVVRINLIERYPVGGIKVNEAVEICVAPLVLQISKLFYTMMMPYFFPEKGEDSDIERGSDNISFVKSESMDFKRPSDNSEGILLGQHIEMNDLDQLLGEMHGNVEATSSGFGITTKFKKLASLTSLKPYRKKEKIFLSCDENLSPPHCNDPVSIILPHHCAIMDVGSDDLRSSGPQNNNLKIDDGPSNQHLAVDYLYQRSERQNKALDILCADFITPAESLHHSATNVDKQTKRSHSERLGQQNIKSDPSLNDSSKDPLQLMAERAKQNYMFLYVKIHGFPIRLSYRGEKQKAFTINNFALNITPIEYHNRLWTWLDLTMEVKKSIKKQLVLEILKQKFKIKKNPFSLVSHSSFNQKLKEEDGEKKKMEMLLGIHALPKEASKKRHGLLQRVMAKKN